MLGRGESLADLPEFSDAKSQAGFDNVRFLDYTPDTKLLVVAGGKPPWRGRRFIRGRIDGRPFDGNCFSSRHRCARR